MVGADLDKMARSSALLGFKEMDGVISRAKEYNFNPNTLIQKLAGTARTTRLASFRSRLTDRDTPEGARETAPTEEFLCLVALALEAGELGLLDYDASIAARGELRWSGSIEEFKVSVGKEAPGLSPDRAMAVVDYLASLREK
jgi:hypothetical protein